jgi:hypothetical protein
MKYIIDNIFFFVLNTDEQGFVSFVEAITQTNHPLQFAISAPLRG